ncbi:AGE family epimerase/isomerase [Ornithinicoccus halotolerans]|uniref:AGE family epimerase/isomerase n=1 Tax=Ornithinicoccus halotolerans TaxID=1748220 RepID=UPI001885B7C7|nr:AGE family epimerase/isomerase [Ornithinicoccus halotolerans]
MDPTDSPWVESPVHRSWLAEQAHRQLWFARRAPHPDGGAWYLDDHGEPDTGRPVQTFITARMVHAYALGHLAGVPGARPVAEACLAGLAGPLRDPRHGGWLASVGPGEEHDDGKAAYPHAFVVLATATATVASLPGAAALLEDALGALDRFWEDGPGMHLDRADRTFQEVSDYRGGNANMHAVEALLAAAASASALMRSTFRPCTAPPCPWHQRVCPYDAPRRPGRAG